MSKEHSEGDRLLTYQHFINGKVQGVGYRRFAQKHAIALGLCGWVRNLKDGRVEVRVQGSADQVSAYVEHLRQGPPFGRVESLETLETEAMKFDRFEIYPDEET